jgi:hypothetical protein
VWERGVILRHHSIRITKIDTKAALARRGSAVY